MSQVLDVNYQIPGDTGGQTLTSEATGRPSKRIRLSAKPLSIATNTKNIAVDIISAPSLDGTFPTPSPRVRRASLPPPSKTGRKKKQPITDPWIQESFTFPSQQPWLEIKSKQKRGALVTDAPPTSIVNDGEELSLDRHADRIAALIAHKRRENDATAFRERIAMRRGEDTHDLLKKKKMMQYVSEQLPSTTASPRYQFSASSPLMQPMQQSSVPSLHIHQSSLLGSEAASDLTLTSPEISQDFPVENYALSYPNTQDYNFTSWLQNTAWTSQIIDALPTTAILPGGFQSYPSNLTQRPFNALLPSPIPIPTAAMPGTDAPPTANSAHASLAPARPNINMFTRQARETMIGGNNTHDLDEIPRRNMFDTK